MRHGLRDWQDQLIIAHECPVFKQGSLVDKHLLAVPLDGVAIELLALHQLDKLIPHRPLGVAVNHALADELVAADPCKILAAAPIHEGGDAMLVAVGNDHFDLVQPVRGSHLVLHLDVRGSDNPRDARSAIPAKS